jgi:hypothetical protein
VLQSHFIPHSHPSDEGFKLVFKTRFSCQDTSGISTLTISSKERVFNSVEQYSSQKWQWLPVIWSNGNFCFPETTSQNNWMMINSTFQRLLLKNQLPPLRCTTFYNSTHSGILTWWNISNCTFGTALSTSSVITFILLNSLIFASYDLVNSASCTEVKCTLDLKEEPSLGF